MDEVRKSLGVCPQHDILFADLTVEEHLTMFASLKGTPRAQLQQEVEQVTQVVGLTEKRRVRSKLLSGGQKRKLSTGTALTGGSRTVFPDEPTSGVDPYSRRLTWSLIRQNRDSRVTVLTTHFMDEAGLLGDRTATMGGGRLRCCGSPLYLKKQFGVGYSMTVEGKDVHKLNSPAVIELIQSRVKDATLLTGVGTELTFQLPFTSSQAFQSLFEHFDSSESQPGTQSYGVSVATLEEVFTKTAHGTGTVATQDRAAHGTDALSVPTGDDFSKAAAKVVTGAAVADAWTAPELEVGSADPKGLKRVVFDKLADEDHFQYFFKHMHGLLYKRFVYFTRDARSWMYQVVTPLLLLVTGCLTMKFTYFDSLLPPLELTTTMYSSELLVSSSVFPVTYNFDTASATALKGGFCTPSAQDQYYFFDESPEYCNPSYALNSNDPDSTYASVDSSGSTYYSPQKQSETPYFKTPQDTMRGVPGLSKLPAAPLALSPDGVWSFLSMSQSIYDAKTKYEASQTGALSLLEVRTKEVSGLGEYMKVSYAAHSSYSAVLGAPLVQKLVVDGTVRDTDPTASVKASTYPLPLTDKQDVVVSSWNSSLTLYFLVLAVPLLPAAPAAYVVREKEAKSRHQQMVSGVSTYAYWLSTFTWDFFSYQIALWLLVVIVAGFDDKGPLSGKGRVGYLVALLQLYGSSVAGLTYLVTSLFATAATAQTAVLGATFLTGFVMTVIGDTFRLLLTKEYSDYTRYFMALLPPFALGSAICSTVYIDEYSFVELKGGKTYEVSDWATTGVSFTLLCASTVIYLLLTTGYDYWKLTSDFHFGSRVLPPTTTSKDEDVLAEEERVVSGQADGSSTLVKDFRRMYPGGKYAVKGVSLGVSQGECFGLLGTSGAGRSSTLSMLSCELKPTVGEALLSGISLIKEPSKCRRKTGFCPQLDALFELLSAREHLTLYDRVKGTHEKGTASVVSQKVSEVGLTEYADRAAGGYSRGNKRKLSVAIAMTGEPSIVLLDEPSTGMDPVARRLTWDATSSTVTKREACSLILTTHSMEECDALCTRTGIMVGGVLRCLGSGQRLRSQYGRGHQLELGLMVPDSEIIHEQATKMLKALKKPLEEYDVLLTRVELETVFKSFGVFDNLTSRLPHKESGADVMASFESSKHVTLKHLASWMILESSVDEIMKFLSEQYGARSTPSGLYTRERQPSKLRVEISSVTENNQRRRLSTMFGAVEAQKEILRIQEYSISQTSLEQVFNSLAAQQEEESGVAIQQ